MDIVAHNGLLPHRDYRVWFGIGCIWLRYRAGNELCLTSANAGDISLENKGRANKMIKVFMSINAAPGNIGDIYIRRQVIRAFDREGVSGFLYAGKMPMSYRDAFDLSERWVMTSSYTKFLWRLGCSYATRKCIFVMAPGPATLGRNFASTLKHILVTFLILIGRITGNRILVLGRAVRAKSKFALFLRD